MPTIADRVAQTVAANRIGTVTEKFFHAPLARAARMDFRVQQE